MLVKAACHALERRSFVVSADTAAKARDQLACMARVALAVVERIDALEGEINGLYAASGMPMPARRATAQLQDRAVRYTANRIGYSHNRQAALDPQLIARDYPCF
ncbi:hypothetical protein ACLBXB_28115 [Methylobacterium mesophilicum]